MSERKRSRVTQCPSVSLRAVELEGLPKSKRIARERVEQVPKDPSFDAEAREVLDAELCREVIATVHHCAQVSSAGASNEMPILDRELPVCSPISEVELPDPLRVTEQEPHEVPGPEVQEEEPVVAMHFEASPRLVASGLIGMVLREMQRLGRRSLSLSEMQTLARSSRVAEENAQSFPVIAVLIQTLEATVSAREMFVGWARRSGFEVPALVGEVSLDGPFLEPWIAQESWGFPLYAMAAQLIARFLSRTRLPAEAVFLAKMSDLKEQMGPDAWVVALMVATLYFLKDAVWFWPTLFRARQVE